MRVNVGKIGHAVRSNGQPWYCDAISAGLVYGSANRKYASAPLLIGFSFDIW